MGGAFLESKTSKTWESLLSWIPDYNTFSGVFRDIAELPHETEDEVGFFNNRGDGIRREDQGLMQEDEVLNLHYSNVYANQGERPPTLGDEPPPAERKRLEAEEQYIEI